MTYTLHTPEVKQYSLASCNDNGLSFLQIADIIEQLYVEPTSN